MNLYWANATNANESQSHFRELCTYTASDTLEDAVKVIQNWIDQPRYKVEDAYIEVIESVTNTLVETIPYEEALKRVELIKKNRPKPTIYLASSFFNKEELTNVEKAENILRGMELNVFSPREHEVRDSGEVGTTDLAKATFESDRKGIQDCDFVVMLYYGNNSNSGTAWECGYAYAIGKPVIVVHLHHDKSNLMIHCGSYTNLNGFEELKKYDFSHPNKYEYTGDMT